MENQDMEYEDRRTDPFELPEDDGDEFDEQAFEQAILNHRRDEFAELAQLN